MPYEVPTALFELLGLKKEMKSIIARDIPFIKKRMLTTEVVDLLNQQGLMDKAQLFEQQGNLFSSLYFLNDVAN